MIRNNYIYRDKVVTDERYIEIAVDRDNGI